VLTLCGLGVCFTGVSHHGSMGEHQVSHWIDMFAGPAHPGTTHGQQVGVASLAIARLHHELLSLDSPPLIKATHIEEKEFIEALRARIGRMCYAEAKKKSFDRAGAEAFNRKLSRSLAAAPRGAAPHADGPRRR
jgi:glycerol-1-phosphate dehydrogenase [NAD(P)+]